MKQFICDQYSTDPSRRKQLLQIRPCALIESAVFCMICSSKQTSLLMEYTMTTSPYRVLLALIISYTAFLSHAANNQRNPLILTADPEVGDEPRDILTPGAKEIKDMTVHELKSYKKKLSNEITRKEADWRAWEENNEIFVKAAGILSIWGPTMTLESAFSLAGISGPECRALSLFAGALGFYTFARHNKANTQKEEQLLKEIHHQLNPPQKKYRQISREPHCAIQ